MRYITFYEKYNNPIYLCLGFFDCIHNGHEMLIKQAIHYASFQNGIETAVLTFSNDPNLMLNGTKQIYTIKERAAVINDLNVDNLITVEFNEMFANYSPIEFLDFLTNNFNIKAIFVGSDYTYGHNAEGDIDSLYEYCKNKNIDLIVIPFVLINDLKLSTRNLKQYIKDGNVDLINEYLTEPYFMIDKVVHGKHNGSKIGFPTFNLIENTNKLELGEGVYSTITTINNKKYMSMTNVGCKPTFNDNNKTIETNIFNFNENIYNKEVKISFIEKIREIKKFNNINELKQQLTKDKEIVQITLKGKL